MVFLAMDSKQIFHNGKSRDNVLTEISRYGFMLFEAVKINLKDTTGGKKNQETSTGRQTYYEGISITERSPVVPPSCRPELTIGVCC